MRRHPGHGRPLGRPPDRSPRAPLRRVPTSALPSAVGLVAGWLALTALGPPTALAARTGANPGQTVEVVAGRPLEFAFSLSSDRVHIGVVTFLVENAGRIPHDFAIRGRSTRSIPPGGRARITVGFARPGIYVYLCTVPGHATAGMEGDLIVRRR
jgi:uncharacterized cupredoxin-like copper-binding protein